jgi:hypothetical protein
MHTRVLAIAAALVLAAPTAAAAQAPVTLGFENVATAAPSHSAALPAQQGYAFHNFRVMSTSEAFGTGANAASGVRFAYAGAIDPIASIYRTDAAFTLSGAALSFRSYDGGTAPVALTVLGYGAGPDPLFTRLLTLTNQAQRFTFDFGPVEEVVFDLSAFTNGRSAVLAVDDVSLAVVPEPGTWVLLATGLGAIALVGARRKA